MHAVRNLTQSRISGLLALLTAAAMTVAGPAAAQDVKAITVKGPVHMLMGKGGNVGVLIGPDGTVMIDDQFAPMTPKLLDAICLLYTSPSPRDPL